jgi:ABC-2 type transport system permease protein
MSAALLIAGKDLRQRMRDRSAFLVVPLVLASIFGLIFHNAIGGKVTFTFGLVDQDRGVVSRIFESAALRPLQHQGLHLTPHAWANEAFTKLVKHGGDLVSVLPQVGVLLGFAAVMLTIAVWQLRRALTG